MEKTVGTEWFENWFDSRYYHILYQNRDHREAQDFIEQLLDYLMLPEGSTVLDLACGKGRHAKFLYEHGLSVTGIDLSVNSIEEAKKMENDDLSFEVGDMRNFSLKRQFDVVFNLFTSFGYFESKSENKQVLRRIGKHLKPGGRLVIDFLNVDFVEQQLPDVVNKKLDGITFNIEKDIEEGTIVKRIRFNDSGRDYEFFERVQALSLTDFKEMLTETGFEIIDTFGDYNLNPFREDTSERLIIIAR